MDTQNYIKNTKKEVDGAHKEWIDDLTARMPTGGVLFEIGSATARDAKYIEHSNPLITVICSDKEQGFVEHLTKTGREAFMFDTLQDNFNKEIPYAAIYAHMVVNHFTLREIEDIIIKAHSAIKQGGYIALSFPLGDNTTLVAWNATPGNVFCRYHSTEELLTIAKKLTIQTVYVKESQDKKMSYITFQI
jgi:hypothetical protein